ncbi:pentapeptide repeat-containing protein [Streptomyces sp. NBC_00252]|uniref:pentapeptide repeat-containing protein n=1 Tax=Streptomyces sp. NBC_00252 TaxID=2975691 RepID=UPI002E2B893E|nr:pentapeptide repeat-containing protein [Streptomyces sp. NBC_00252]
MAGNNGRAPSAGRRADRRHHLLGRFHQASTRTAAYADLDLDGTSLAAKCLIGLEFRDCDLRGVDFTGSDLSYARFINCDLYLAKFDESILYATWLVDSNLTKASFKGTFLAGVRMKSVDITHTEFDQAIPIGRVRKPTKTRPDYQAPPTYRLVRVGEDIGDAKTLEKNHDGIHCVGFSRAIRFFDDPPEERWRRWRRREEVAKILKILQLDNGYYERALKYYYLERKFRRRSIPWKLKTAPRRIADFFLGELLWAYGTSITRPFAAYSLATVLTTVALLLIPDLDSSSGLVPSDCPGRTCHPLQGLTSSGDLLSAAYYLMSTTFGNNSFEPAGIARIIFIIYNLFSLILLSLLFSSASRRLANI